MKFVMDDRVKHRLTGLVVIISIAVIFLPAMLKKSNHHLAENINVSLKLPSKPVPPKVAIPNQTTMFQSVKVAHVELPALLHEQRVSQIAKAEPIIKKPTEIVAPVVAKATSVNKSKQAAIIVPATKPVTVAKAATATPLAPKKLLYAVQLGSFSQKSNAELLVSRLRKQGYIASYNKFNGKQGEYYQVLVGHLNQKDQAINLQKKLASNLQLSGLIVKTDVS